mmetsp:Transcript_21950/g.66710  ORF Transcript_21950/g.66710 Transcript_21950/m.66710 type:complete len:236 (-) Transcript_21950:1900-2607(-)
MSGSIHRSRRLSGLGRKKKSCSTSPNSCQRSGALLRQSSAGLLRNASSIMSDCSTRPRAGAMRATPPPSTTPGGSARVKSTPILSLSLLALTLSIWTRTRRKCSPKRAPALPIPVGRRPSAKRERSSSRNHDAWPRFRSVVSSRRLESSWRVAHVRCVASTTTRRSPSRRWRLLATLIPPARMWLPRRRQAWRTERSGRLSSLNWMRRIATRRKRRRVRLTLKSSNGAGRRRCPT